MGNPLQRGSKPDLPTWRAALERGKIDRVMAPKESSTLVTRSSQVVPTDEFEEFLETLKKMTPGGTMWAEFCIR